MIKRIVDAHNDEEVKEAYNVAFRGAMVGAAKVSEVDDSRRVFLSWSFAVRLVCIRCRSSEIMSGTNITQSGIQHANLTSIPEVSISRSY